MHKTQNASAICIQKMQPLECNERHVVYGGCSCRTLSLATKHCQNICKLSLIQWRQKYLQCGHFPGIDTPVGNDNKTIFMNESGFRSIQDYAFERSRNHDQLTLSNWSRLSNIFHNFAACCANRHWIHGSPGIIRFYHFDYSNTEYFKH